MGYYFKIHKKSNILPIDQIALMPVGGAEELITAGKWAAAEHYSYVILLDNDKKGRKVKKDIKKRHREIDESRVVLLKQDESPEKIDIEDMLDPTLYVKCVNSVYSSRVKNYKEMSVEKSGGDWIIDGIDYDDEDIVSLIESALDNRDISYNDGKLHKRAVSEELRERLVAGTDVNKRQVEEFKPLLGQLRALISN